MPNPAGQPWRVWCIPVRLGVRGVSGVSQSDSARRAWELSEVTTAAIWREAAVNPPIPIHLTHLTHRGVSFYRRFPADRRQAGLPRAPPRIKSLGSRGEFDACPIRLGIRGVSAVSPIRFCPEGVGAFGGYDGSDLARSGSKHGNHHPPDPPRRQLLPPVPGGSSASRTPTGSAQSQKPWQPWEV